MIDYYEHDLSDGSSAPFFSNPLDRPSDCHFPKNVPPDLLNVLLDSSQYEDVQVSPEEVDKIFLGVSSVNPADPLRFPVWLPSEILSSHLLILGSIGSGKSTLNARLVAGALNTFGTVVIGEAKGGVRGTANGAAFTYLAQYLSQRLAVKAYRFPRGNCWFNPLLYLSKRESRRSFLLTLIRQIETGGGELKAYLEKAVDIAAIILDWMVTNYVSENDRRANLTLRNLIILLKRPQILESLLEDSILKSQKLPEILRENNDFKQDLTRFNFFSLKSEQGREKFIMTSSGINFLTNLLDREDLLFYTEEHKHDREGNSLMELKLDDESEGILYNRSIVVVSQPINDSSSKVVGPLFWDSLLNCVLDLGPKPPSKNGKSRQKVAVFLDETNRLPVGQLGDSGDFLRQYDLALIEITPSIVDKERWERNKHVYQTIISLSPSVYEGVSLVYERLPNFLQAPFQIGMDIQTNPDGSIRVVPKVDTNPIQQQIGQDNPGVSMRSLGQTGRYTALLQSNLIKNAWGVFWIDLESHLMAKLDVLLHDAVFLGDEVACNVADYALGLVKGYVN